ncbi:Dynein assembly factor with WDR repeat domains 1 (Outer row dynein assembly protein 16) [Durusdinium trenchii]|uniref:Dynein assembly factor with WDR repeat domains 1 (Outer row dynein assembly protein 16) n=1 Tax=Durusdinium trenchii TaxID=1381693 RepID=A0ABP0RLV6_9DINO
MHPRIILEYHGINGDLETKSIELGSLDPETDVDALVKKLVREEGLISESNKEALQKMIFKLMDKIKDQESQRFELVQILRGHLLPLTSCSFNKSCSKILTASFDRSCRVWDVFGEELLTLEGHDGPVNAAEPGKAKGMKRGAETCGNHRSQLVFGGRSRSVKWLMDPLGCLVGSTRGERRGERSGPPSQRTAFGHSVTHLELECEPSSG